MKKVFCLMLVFALVLVSGAAWAYDLTTDATANDASEMEDEIQQAITAAIGGDDEIDVTGAAAALDGTIHLYIPEGFTVNWQATATLKASVTGPVIELVAEDASHNPSGGEIIFTQNGDITTADDDINVIGAAGGVTITVNAANAAIKAKGTGTVILNAGTGAVNILDGTVAASGATETAIDSAGPVTINTSATTTGMLDVTDLILNGVTGFDLDAVVPDPAGDPVPSLATLTLQNDATLALSAPVTVGTLYLDAVDGAAFTLPNVNLPVTTAVVATNGSDVKVEENFNVPIKATDSTVAVDDTKTAARVEADGTSVVTVNGAVTALYLEDTAEAIIGAAADVAGDNPATTIYAPNESDSDPAAKITLKAVTQPGAGDPLPVKLDKNTSPAAIIDLPAYAADDADDAAGLMEALTALFGGNVNNIPKTLEKVSLNSTALNNTQLEALNKAIDDERTKDEVSGGGCSAASFGLFALALVIPFVFKKKKA